MPRTLYSLHLSTHKPGMVKGPVACERAVMSGHYREFEADIVRPVMADVRSCLPHYYRKAFDRAGSGWFPSTPGNTADNGPAYIALRTSKGRHMNTLYMQPIAASV